jgi:hypothetical protein
MNKKALFFPLAAASVCTLALWFSRLQTSRYTVSIQNLPKSMEGLEIAHVSDLHGRDGSRVLYALQKEKPDLIAATGDIFDGVQESGTALQFLKDLVKIAPVYMVSGNHEYYRKDWKQLQNEVRLAGVHLLENEVQLFQKGDAVIEIAGIAEPDLYYGASRAKRNTILHQQEALLPEKKHPRILLFHRADMNPNLQREDYDLILGGHLHGGHWRLFGKGLICPNDGDGISFFPAHSAGIYRERGMSAEISRGLGDNMIVPRLFNRPQLVILTLHEKK